MQGHGIPVTVANTTYMGMEALHAVGGLGKLPVYQYLMEVYIGVAMPDITQVFRQPESCVCDDLEVQICPCAGAQETTSCVRPTSPASPMACASPHSGALLPPLWRSSTTA